MTHLLRIYECNGKDRTLVDEKKVTFPIDISGKNRYWFAVEVVELP